MKTPSSAIAGNSEISETATPMSIASEDHGFLMDMLGTLYSKPARAVLREYLSNAYDAHIAKGGTLPPIQVTLPTENNPLTIRDFGNGMSEEDFQNILSRYGASTKRDTNKQIGGFGIGAKSGFAIGDEFFMTSYQNGTELKVKVFKDKTNTSFIDVVHRRSTSEPDGMLVEIKISAVKLLEVRPTSLTHFFLGYKREELEVSPAGNFLSLHDSNDFDTLTLEGHHKGWVGKNAKPIQYKNRILILIGKVLYSVKPSDIYPATSRDEVELTTFLAQFSRPLVIEVPISAVDLPASREEITLSERSINALRNAVSNYMRHLHIFLQKEINTLKFSEAMKKIVSLEEVLYPERESFTWRGVEINLELLQSSLAVTACVTSFIGARSAHSNVMSVSKISEFRKIFTGRAVAVIPRKNDMEICSTVEFLTGHGRSRSVLNLLKASPNGKTPSEALFITLPYTDPLYALLSEETQLNPSDIDVLINAEREAYETLTKDKKAQEEAEAANTLTSFGLNSDVPTYLKARYVADTFKSATESVFYWSEEELKSIRSVLADIRSAFPYVPGPKKNTYKVSMGKLDGIAYQNELAGMLSTLFPSETRLIVLDSSVNLKDFSDKYPTVRSGVHYVKGVIEAEMNDENSKLRALADFILSRKYLPYSDLQKLQDFYESLSESQQVELDEDFTTVYNRFSSVELMRQRYSLTSLENLTNLISIFTSEALEPKMMDLSPYIRLQDKYYLLFRTLSSQGEIAQKVAEELLFYIQAKMQAQN